MNIISGSCVYVRIGKNEISVRNIETGREAASAAEFTTDRLLVGRFSQAEATLRKLMPQVLDRRWLRPSPAMVVHALAMTAGGLSEVEERVLRELAVSAGARRVRVWVGPALTDAEVAQQLRDN